MLRMTKQTDYGIILLTRFARELERSTLTARDLAAEARLPQPMVSKILKVLAREGFLVSHRGVKGGYSLARDPETVRMSEVVAALEGPVAITECSQDAPGACSQEPHCEVSTNLRRINMVIRDALDAISLREMAQPMPADVRLSDLRSKEATACH